MKTMSEENKENPSEKIKQPISELLMKPFSLGWTREVVRRVVTHSGTPNCDIYYFNPNKKKLRSLTEVKSNLTDGLSLECFSFKREPLGLSPDLETVRDAKVRGKGGEKSREKRKAPDRLNKPTNNETEDDASDVGKKPKRKKTESEEEDSKPKTEKIETETNNSEKLNSNTNMKDEEEKEGKNEGEKEEGDDLEEKEISEEKETKTRRAKSDTKDSTESKNFVSKNRRKSKGKPAKPTKPVRLQSVRKRKTTLKRVMNMKQAKQAKVVPGRKKLKEIVRKKVSTSKLKLSKTQRDKKVSLKSKKNSPQKVKPGRKPVKNSLAKTKNEVSKGPETNETDKKSVARDLKSIVQKNIGKYREMREKQKLGVVKNQTRSPSKKLPISNLPRSRSEPISKNKPFYLKPLEKGWRRELVYRTNCAKAGQQADVYYFHPNGKKLRSCREIAENLTHGLSIECFTFRKEPLGCGEPSEVIRNARSFQKN